MKILVRAYDLPSMALDRLSVVPVEVVSRLGVAPSELGRFRSSRVLLGNGLVLKAGPPERAAREAFVLEELGGLPVRVPVVVDTGEGWLLLHAVEVVDADVAAWKDDSLADLAQLHESFVGNELLGDPRLRGVTRGELAPLRERSASLARELDLPEPLRVLGEDPEPLLAQMGCGHAGPRGRLAGERSANS
jgi:hypothetical protein